MSSEYKDYGFPDALPSHMHRHFMPPLMRFAGEKQGKLRVLDIGCGNGYLAGCFHQQGHYAVGIDLSEQGIAMARKTYPDARFEVLGATEHVLDDLQEKPFDVIVSTEVIEHLYAPRAFVDGCMKALNPGGRLILTTPYHGYLKNLVLSIMGKWDQHADPLWDGGHIKLWSKASLTTLLQERGFQNVQFAGAGRLPWMWMTMVMCADRPV
jgi:2-polyprenyl-3-methyl-5-hydroxy-6-metoxy-1,4-benzoquinol methylase